MPVRRPERGRRVTVYKKVCEGEERRGDKTDRRRLSDRRILYRRKGALQEFEHRRLRRGDKLLPLLQHRPITKGDISRYNTSFFETLENQRPSSNNLETYLKTVKNFFKKQGRVLSFGEDIQTTVVTPQGSKKRLKIIAETEIPGSGFVSIAFNPEIHRFFIATTRRLAQRRGIGKPRRDTNVEVRVE